MAALFLALPVVMLPEMSPGDIDSLLSSPSWVESSPSERLRTLALLRTGTPYALGCLGEGKGGDVDPDPIFRLDSTDCTVLVLTDAALARSTSLAEAKEAIIAIHYRGGKVDYANRYHFTVDRILHSPGFEEITAEAAGDSLLEEISLTLNRTAEGTALLDIPWELTVTARFLPADRLTPEIAERLGAVCGVAFVNRRNVAKGYLVSHEGIVFDGAVLHHASSSSGKVVSVPFLEYLAGEGDTPRFDGVIFYKFL